MIPRYRPILVALLATGLFCRPVDAGVYHLPLVTDTPSVKSRATTARPGIWSRLRCARRRRGAMSVSIHSGWSRAPSWIVSRCHRHLRCHQHEPFAAIVGLPASFPGWRELHAAAPEQGRGLPLRRAGPSEFRGCPHRHTAGARARGLLLQERCRDYSRYTPTNLCTLHPKLILHRIITSLDSWDAGVQSRQPIQPIHQADLR